MKGYDEIKIKFCDGSIGYVDPESVTAIFRCGTFTKESLYLLLDLKAMVVSGIFAPVRRLLGDD